MLKVDKKFGYYKVYLKSDSSPLTGYIELNVYNGWEIHLDSGYGQTVEVERLQRKNVIPELKKILPEEDLPLDEPEIQKAIDGFRIKWSGVLHDKGVYDSSVPTEEAIRLMMETRRVVEIPEYYDTVGEASDYLDAQKLENEQGNPWMDSENSTYMMFPELMKK